MEFRLNSAPVDVQLSYHMMNLVAYFHPANTEQRLDLDKNSTHATSRILTTLMVFVVDSNLIEGFLQMRHAYPMEFRAAQMVQHYGPEKIASWIELIYGKRVERKSEETLLNM